MLSLQFATQLLFDDYYCYFVYAKIIDTSGHFATICYCGVQEIDCCCSKQKEVKMWNVEKQKQKHYD